MIISAREVRANRQHKCDGEDCGYMGCSGRIDRNDMYYRLYGAGSHGDPPYVLKLSQRCVKASRELRTALKRTTSKRSEPFKYTLQEVANMLEEIRAANPVLLTTFDQAVVYLRASSIIPFRIGSAL